MQPFLPDSIKIEVKWRGNDLPCQLNLLQSGGTPAASADLNLPDLHQAVAQLDMDEMLDHGEYGQALFNFLFPQPLRDEYFRLAGQADESGLRMTLDLDPDAPGIHTIPWERMYFPRREALFPLAVEPSIVFSRLLKTIAPEATPRSSGILRALVALTNPFPEGDPLHFDEALERQKITAAFAAYPSLVASVEIPKPVTLEAVLERLEEDDVGFDILYFSGHGFWKKTPAPQGKENNPETGQAFLIFEKEDGTPDRVELDTFKLRIARTAQMKRLPRLVFLSACHTAIKANTQPALLGFAPELVKAGCPAVICMQESIEEPAARFFAAKFFYELFKHGCIDLAVNRARAELFQAHSWQWAIPVLFMHIRDGMLFWPKERFQALLNKPYKYLVPFSREDAAIFKGREVEIQKIIRAVSQQRLTVVHGPDGIGLTSLIEAGVCPRLDSENTLVFTLSEYNNLASQIHAQLWASRLHFALPTDGSPSPRQVLEAALSSSLHHEVNRIILVFDQFERALRLSIDQRQQVRDALKDILELEALRIVLVVHDNWRDALEPWQEALPDLIAPYIAVGPLRFNEVGEVISSPLETNQFPVRQVEYGLANREIPKDLADLYQAASRDSGDNPAGENPPVDPGQLQIVCDWLYREADSQKLRMIPPELYNNAGRADGILARTMTDTLEWHFASEPDLTREVLVSMVAPNPGRWVELKNIAPKHSDRDQVLKVLDRLVDFELVICVRSDGIACYAFANQTVQRKAIELGGNELSLQYQAEGEIERIWRMWLVNQLRRDNPPASASSDHPELSENRALATVEQLRTLCETSGHLHPDNLRILLLLRSAVYHDEPEDVWLQWLDTAPQVKMMLKSLETNHLFSQAENCKDTEVKQAVQLLGLDCLLSPQVLAINQNSFGPLAWAAVGSPQRTSRKTAALALSTIFASEDLVIRLENALDTWKKQPVREFLPIWRHAEVFGNLMDAGKLAASGGGKGRGGGFWNWAWRVNRRLSRHNRRLTVMVVGSAVGAALALGGWYFLLNLLAISALTGPSLPLYAFLGAILGAVIALGLGFAEPALLEDSREPELSPPQWRRPLRRAWLPDVLAAALSTLLFGVTHALLVIIVAFPSAPLWHMIPMGFIAGLGFSLGLYGQPRAGIKLGWRGWLPRLAAAGLLVAATQFVPCLAGIDWFSTNFTFSAAKIQSLYMQYGWINSFFGPTACQPGYNFQGLLSAVNAGLIGALITTFCAIGMDTALRLLKEWRQREN